MTKLDYYLTYAHKARVNTTLLSIVGGACIGMISERAGLSSKLATILCVSFVGTVEIIRALIYVRPADESREVADLSSPTRRSLVLLPVPVMLVIAAALIPAPRIEAAVVSRRLRQFASGTNPRLDKLNAVVSNAIEDGIAVSPQHIDAAKSQVAKAFASNLTPSARLSAASSLARLEGYKVFSENVRAEKSQPYVNIQTRVSYLTIQGPGPPDDKSFYIGIASPDEDSTLLYHVRIKDVYQPIDRFKWVDCIFEDVGVLYYGGDLFLSDVKFKNCKFEAGTFFNPHEETSRIVVERLKQFNNGPPVSLVVIDGRIYG